MSVSGEYRRISMVKEERGEVSEKKQPWRLSTKRVKGEKTLVFYYASFLNSY